MTFLGEVGRIEEPMSESDITNLTMNVPITVDVPASTPSAAVHLLIACAWSQAQFQGPVNPPIDNAVIRNPVASWGYLKYEAESGPVVPATSNPYIVAGPFFAAQQDPQGYGFDTALYLGCVRDAIPGGQGRVVSLTWAAGATFTFRGAIVYAVRGIAADASLWPTTSVVPVRPCTFFGSVVGDVNNIWSGGAGSSPEVQTWLGEGMFFAMCAHQFQPMPTFAGFIGPPPMVNDGHLTGTGRTGGRAFLFPVFDPGGGAWHQHLYHAGDISPVLDIDVTPAPGTSPDIRGTGGGLINFIAGPGLP